VKAPGGNGGNVTSGGRGTVTAASAEWSPFHRASMMVRAAPASRSRTTPLANVIGDSTSANRPNTTSHTAMIERSLDRLDMVVTLLSWGLPTNAVSGRPWPSLPRVAAVNYAATWILICFGLASSRSGSRTVRTPALYSALTLPASTVGGSVNVRANGP